MTAPLVAALVLMATAAAGLISTQRAKIETSQCRTEAATEALAYERLLTDRDATIVTLKGDIKTQQRSMETAQQVANLAASEATARALRRLNAPRPVIEGSGPEVMNQWLDQ